MGKVGDGEYPPVSRAVPDANETRNKWSEEVVGSKKDAAVAVANETASIIAYQKGTIGLLHTLIESRLTAAQNYPSLTTIDGVFRFACSLIDNDSGAIASANITAGTFKLYKNGVQVGGPAATAFSKVAGSIYADITFDDVTWNSDDVYTLTPQLDTIAVIDGVNYYAPLVSWSGVVSDLGALETKVDSVKTDTGTNIPATLVRKISTNVFWSEIIPAITIPAVMADIIMGDVIIPITANGGIPTGATIVSVKMIFAPGKKEDTSGALNAIKGAATWRIKLSTGVWGTDDIIAMDVVDNSLETKASQVEGGLVIMGNRELKALVTGAGTYNFAGRNTVSLDAPIVDGASLRLTDTLIGLKVKWY